MEISAVGELVVRPAPRPGDLPPTPTKHRRELTWFIQIEPKGGDPLRLVDLSYKKDAQLIVASRPEGCKWDFEKGLATWRGAIYEPTAAGESESLAAACKKTLDAGLAKYRLKVLLGESFFEIPLQPVDSKWMKDVAENAATVRVPLRAIGGGRGDAAALEKDLRGRIEMLEKKAAPLERKLESLNEKLREVTAIIEECWACKGAGYNLRYEESVVSRDPHGIPTSTISTTYRMPCGICNTTGKAPRRDSKLEDQIHKVKQESGPIVFELRLLQSLHDALVGGDGTERAGPQGALPRWK